jgi:uncharacterized membrane protein
MSDTLPGVAIAISVVPPLSVVGLTLEAHAYNEASGALLLFGTNVAAILATGIVVMALYRVHSMALRAGETDRSMNRRNATPVIVVVVGVPLTLSSISITRDTTREVAVREAASSWADEVGWDLEDVTTRQGNVIVKFEGSLPCRTPPASAPHLWPRGSSRTS